MTKEVKYTGVFRRDQALMLLLYHGLLKNKLEFTRTEVDEYFKRVLENLQFSARIKTTDTGVRHEVIDEFTADRRVVQFAHLVPHKKALSIALKCGIHVGLDSFMDYEYKVLTGELLEEYENSLFKLLDMPMNPDTKTVDMEELAPEDDYIIKINKNRMKEYIEGGNIKGRIILNYADPINATPVVKRNIKILEEFGVYEFESDKIENGEEIFRDTYYRVKKQAVDFITKLKSDKKKQLVKINKSIVKDSHTQLDFFDVINKIDK